MANSSLIPKTDREKARQEILAALERLDCEATESELVVATGIATALVEETLTQLAKEFRCEQRLSENGALRYRFARGPELRADRPAARATLRRMGSFADIFARRAFGQLLFFPLVGYFALFVLLPLPPGLLIFTLIFALSWTLEALVRRNLDCAPSMPVARRPAARGMDRPRSCRTRAVSSRTLRTRQRGRIATAPEALYAFLFDRGRRELSRWNKMEVLEVLDFLRCRKGMVSRAEIMKLTGLTPEQARAYASELLRAYQGEPVVTEGGSVVYRFDELLASMRSSGRSGPPVPPKPGREASRSVREESEKRFGRVIAFMNGANLFFGAFYGVLVLGRFATGLGAAATVNRDSSGVWRFFGSIHALIVTGLQLLHPLVIAALVVGVIPAGVAAVYFGLHFAARREREHVRRIMRRRQLRKVVYSHVLANPESVDPSRIEPGGGAPAGTATREQVERIVDELAAAFGAEIEDTGEGHYVYHFPELEQEMHELDSARLAVNPALFASEAEAVRSREPPNR